MLHACIGQSVKDGSSALGNGLHVLLYKNWGTGLVLQQQKEPPPVASTAGHWNHLSDSSTIWRQYMTYRFKQIIFS